MQSAKALLIEMPRAWQAGFAIVPLKTEHSDESISAAQEWLHQNFHQSFPLEAPAERVNMSLRNFVRRFKQATGDSPLIYLQKLRVAAAKRLLENDRRTMQEISDAVGLSRSSLLPPNFSAAHRSFAQRLSAEVRRGITSGVAESGLTPFSPRPSVKSTMTRVGSPMRACCPLLRPGAGALSDGHRISSPIIATQLPDPPAHAAGGFCHFFRQQYSFPSDERLRPS